jgi:hypothetical protein
MVERYMKEVQTYLRNVFSTHQTDWDERTTIFLLAYRASTHKTTGSMPASKVFGRELHPTCDLLLRALLGTPGRRTSLAVLTDPDQREVTQAPAIL